VKTFGVKKGCQLKFVFEKTFPKFVYTFHGCLIFFCFGCGSREMENGWVNPWWWIISGCDVRHAFVWFAFQSEIQVNEILRKMRRSSLG